MHAVENDTTDKPEPEKVKAIKEMTLPNGELETVLGMIHYLDRFVPKLSKVNTPLRQLLKQTGEFVWVQADHKAGRPRPLLL